MLPPFYAINIHCREPELAGNEEKSETVICSAVLALQVRIFVCFSIRSDCTNCLREQVSVTCTLDLQKIERAQEPVLLLSAQNKAKIISRNGVTYTRSSNNIFRHIKKSDQENTRTTRWSSPLLRNSYIETRHLPVRPAEYLDVFQSPHYRSWLTGANSDGAAGLLIDRGASGATQRELASPAPLRRPVYRKGRGFCSASISPHKNTRLRSAMGANAAKNRRNNSAGPQFIPEFRRRTLLMKTSKATASCTIRCASSLESPRGIFSPWRTRSHYVKRSSPAVPQGGGGGRVTPAPLSSLQLPWLHLAGQAPNSEPARDPR